MLVGDREKMNHDTLNKSDFPTNLCRRPAITLYGSGSLHQAEAYSLPFCLGQPQPFWACDAGEDVAPCLS